MNDQARQARQDHQARDDGRVPLAAALRQAAAHLQLQAPPADLQARVLAAARAAMPAAQPTQPATPAAAGKPRRGTWAWSAWSGAGACATVLVAATVLMLRLPPPAAPPPQALRTSGFMPLVAAERWPDDAATGWIVSTELQGERLAALGLPFDPARAADSVRAELLVRPSGEVLAVRFIR